MRLFDELGLAIDAGVAAAILSQGVLLGQGAAAARDLAHTRWVSLQGVDGADRALLPLATALAEAHKTLGDVRSMAAYDDHRLQLAEALGDRDALAHAQLGMAVRLSAIGASETGMALLASAAGIARASDNLGRLSHALSNIASFQMNRDLPAALEASAEAVEAARRSGSSYWLEFARANRLLTLWRAGYLAETRVLAVDMADSLRDIGLASIIPVVAAWIEEAIGVELGITVDPSFEQTDDHQALAWWDYHRMEQLPGTDSSTWRCPWPSAPWPSCSPVASTTTSPTCGPGWSRPRWRPGTWRRLSGSSCRSRPPLRSS